MKDLGSFGLCPMPGRGSVFFPAPLILPNGLGLSNGKGTVKLDPSDKGNMRYSYFLRVKTHSGAAQKAAVVWSFLLETLPVLKYIMHQMWHHAV